ncbi:uncharacterized protein LOC124259121 [Haliotis rubra]|uniref:uncharacterized protein LOC124259121 n=1 Tax=Haliotis rubra TaxID=36100 RepID=UPI001EE5A7EB|nr:uncharacterized protein LOC124259121 [Haliotis rubra]
MRIQSYLLLLTTSLCLAAEVAGAKHEVLSGNKVVKRDIFDDLRNLFASAGSSIKTFTQETYNKIAENLPSMGLDDLKKTLNDLKSIYQKIGDKSSDEARRVQKLISEVDKDIAANGSTSWRGSLAGTVALMVLTAYLNN